MACRVADVVPAPAGDGGGMRMTADARAALMQRLSGQALPAPPPMGGISQALPGPPGMPGAAPAVQVCMPRTAPHNVHSAIVVISELMTHRL